MCVVFISLVLFRQTRRHTLDSTRLYCPVHVFHFARPAPRTHTIHVYDRAYRASSIEHFHSQSIKTRNKHHQQQQQPAHTIIFRIFLSMLSQHFSHYFWLFHFTLYFCCCCCLCTRGLCLVCCLFLVFWPPSTKTQYIPPFKKPRHFWSSVCAHSHFGYAFTIHSVCAESLSASLFVILFFRVCCEILCAIRFIGN